MEQFKFGEYKIMNRKIGTVCSAINIIAVGCFALSMLIGNNFISYFSSMFIALSFVPMMCAYAYFSEQKRKLAGYVSSAFAVMYAVIILLVYFAQVTTVRLDNLTQQTSEILDFQQFGLFFSYDLLGYSLMALSTFFAGLTVKTETKKDRWLKGLLLIHGIFFFSCLIAPVLGIFEAGNESWIGIALLEFWCVYFLPISILSYLHFSKIREINS